MGVQHTNKVKL